MSSCESELEGGVETTKMTMWLRNQLDFLGHRQSEPTTLYEDNTSMITLSSNFSGHSKRMKHCLQKVNFMMEQVHQSVVRLAYLRTEDHTADILTKPLAPLVHWHHVGPLLGEHPAVAAAKEEVFTLKGRAICMRADIVTPFTLTSCMRGPGRRVSHQPRRHVHFLSSPTNAEDVLSVPAEESLSAVESL